MDDLGRPSRRQASSSRRSSTQRIRPRPRASNQSLHSAGRPQENTTFTSFEPFSPPNTLTSNANSNSLVNSSTNALFNVAGNGLLNVNGNGDGSGNGHGHGHGHGHGGRDDASVGSYSSSKRSRSIFAPNRANSVMERDESEEGAEDSTSGETEGDMECEAASGSDVDTRTLSQVSAASQSLINAVLNMAPQDDTRPPLFSDMNNPLNNPSVLAEASDQTIATLVKRQGGVAKVIRRLAKDVADRDAEMSRLRRRNEEFGGLFKDHLMNVHNMSRLDADKTVRALSPLTPVDSLPEDLESATANPFSHGNEFSSNDTLPRHSSESTDALISRSRPESPDPGPYLTSTARPSNNQAKSKNQAINPQKRGSLFSSLFGGSTALRQNKSRSSIASVLDYTGMRSPSITRSRSNSMSSYKPLEMEQKIENEHLPPPLLDMKVIKIIFREFIADNYGFIIDAPRVTQWLLATSLNNNRPVTPKGKPRSLSTATRTSSITSADDVPPESDVHEESRPWHEYLTLEVTKQALLSRLPIQLQGQKSSDRSSISSDQDSTLPKLEDVIDPADFTTHADQLRDEISVEYTSLQSARGLAYDRLMLKLEEKPVSNRLSRIFSNNLEPTPRNRVESMGSGTVGIANLATSGVGAPFMRFVLDGIPMNKRAKIWLESAQSSIHYSPEDFSMLKIEFNSDPAQKYLHDIRMDAPRTLTNNVYFRKEKHQEELATLLACFAIRNKDIGYCQGFNIIAGYLLLAMPTTEQAFWVFCYLVEKVLPPAYFTAEYDWQGPRADTIVLRQYIRQLMPKLGAHLDDLEIPAEQTVPINWFLTAFASTLSVEQLFRVWDVVLGIPGQQVFLLHVAIALLKLNEEELLKVGDAAGLYDYMDRKMARGVVSIDGLVQASSRLGPIVTARSVEKRRAEAAKMIV